MPLQGSLPLAAPILISNAAIAFGLNLSVFLLIGKTSALAMNIAGVVKDWLLIGLSTLLFNAQVLSSLVFTVADQIHCEFRIFAVLLQMTDMVILPCYFTLAENLMLSFSSSISQVESGAILPSQIHTSKSIRGKSSLMNQFS